MQLNEELGILYDVTCFGNTYFNQELIELRYEKESLPIDLRMKAYQEIEAKLGTISPVLRLFFFSAESAESVVDIFLNRTIISGNIGLDMFLSHFDNEIQIFDMLTSMFFSTLDERKKRRLISRDIPLWYQVCEESNLAYDIKMALLYLAASYESVQLEIRRDLFRIYTEVKSYHVAHNSGIVNVKERLDKKESVKQLTNRVLVDLSEAEEETLVLGVSMLNPLVIFGARIEKIVTLVCGSEYDLPEKTEVKSINVSIADFVISCGSKQKVDILFLFREHGELTAAQLARLLGVSAPMAWRYVEMLRENKVLVVKRQEAKNIYYGLNSDYFYGVLHSVEEFIKCFDGEEKKDE